MGFKGPSGISTNQSIADEVIKELEVAESKFDPFHSSHEGYAVILEELDELWDVVKLNPNKIHQPINEENPQGTPIYFEKLAQWQIKERKRRMRAEAIQVAAMAIRFIKCICNDE